jgi:hypothetical protein
MQSGTLPVIRIADDGDLADVRQLIEEIGVEWVAEDEAQDRPTALWIGTPGRLIAARVAGAQAAAPATFRIVVADKMTKTLQRQLERERPDFLVSRPFHPAALRLLILHALYVGPERRTSARLAISTMIRFRTSVFSRAATLVELSRGGCRLIARSVPALGESVTVILPRELIGNGGLSLVGRVVAADPAGGFEPGDHACSIAFEAVDNEERRVLLNMLARHAVGSASLVLRAGPHASAASSPAAARAVGPAKIAARPAAETAAPQTPASLSSERRRSPRRAYPRPVLASGGGTARVLIGRDLSSGGMRVAADANLIVGAALKLAVHGPAGRAPLLVRAVVLRNDGEDGCVLRFENLAPQTVAELTEWTRLLPNLTGSTLGKAPAVHSIVSEIVEEPEGSS